MIASFIFRYPSLAKSARVIRPYSLFLTQDEAVLALSGKKADTLKAKIVGTAHASKPSITEFKTGIFVNLDAPLIAPIVHS